MTRIVSSLPGRIRLRDAALKNPARSARLAAALAALPAVASVEANCTVGSLLIHYDAAQCASDAIERQVEAALDAELQLPRSALPPSTRVRINRAAKYGMLASLGSSLVLAALGNKRWHAATGLVFVACLGAHLTVHRRHLLR